MARRVPGVIARSERAPVELVTVQVPDPGPGEVLVRVQACGVCHTDLHYREGAINDQFPFLLGHEAAGKIEAVGPDVANVAPGDFVVLAWRAPCGQCRSCLRGRPWYCFDSRNARQRMTLEDGTPLAAAIGIGAFAELCLVAAGQAVKVDPAARPEAAGLVGCGIMAGYGAIVNTAKVERGDTVAVFGCGGVGNAAIHAAALAGARKVIAVDVDRRKLELARQFGATDLVDSSQVNPVSAIRELTGGFGAHAVLECVGTGQATETSVAIARPGGAVGRVGVPHYPAVPLAQPMFFKNVKVGGGPAPVRAYIDELLPDILDGNIEPGRVFDRTVELEGVPDGYRAMAERESIKVLVRP